MYCILHALSVPAPRIVQAMQISHDAVSPAVCVSQSGCQFLLKMISQGMLHVTKSWQQRLTSSQYHRRCRRAACISSSRPAAGRCSTPIPSTSCIQLPPQEKRILPSLSRGPCLTPCRVI